MRQYLPKGTDLSGYSQERFEAVADEINARPGATPDASTPLEVYGHLLMTCRPLRGTSQ